MFPFAFVLLKFKLLLTHNWKTPNVGNCPQIAFDCLPPLYTEEAQRRLHFTKRFPASHFGSV